MKDVSIRGGMEPYVPMKHLANGGDLPESRKRTLEQGLTYFQEVLTERDVLQSEVARLKTEIAALKVACEAHNAQQNEMQSRVNTMTLVRDQAVADRAKYEALFVMINAQMRAFAVPAAPLVTAAKEEPELDSEDIDAVRKWQAQRT